MARKDFVIGFCLCLLFHGCGGEESSSRNEGEGASAVYRRSIDERPVAKRRLEAQKGPEGEVASETPIAALKTPEEENLGALEMADEAGGPRSVVAENAEARLEDESPQATGGQDGDEAISDSEPPSLVSVAFIPRQAIPGDEVSIHVTARDNISGVASVFGEVRSPSGSAGVPFSSSAPGEEGSLICRFKIPDQAETGRWQVASLRLKDRVHNERTYSREEPAFQDSYVEITESGSDSRPPEVTAVRLDPPEAAGGEAVNVTIEAQDDRSGVARIHGILLSPSGNARLSFASQPDDQSAAFSGSVTLPKDAESGDWVLDYLRVEDQAKNAKVFHRSQYPELFTGAYVSVRTDLSDAQPPALDSLAIEPSVVAHGETATIIVLGTDDASGVSSVSGSMRSPSGAANLSFWCRYDSNSNDFRADITVQPNTELGLWRVDYIRIEDNAHNQAYYRSGDNALVEQTRLEVVGR